MDQLNSHKLRHQAKSLICEICAYSCKRKNELRNHMLAKHSGEEKQPSAYQCKYCTYTTCYKQALQNHENCKHTKLKEFRCALCFYFSFSSISLFLHKRKAHGYVPGDKAWLENYAAKEKERNSAELVQDFYNKPSTVPKEQSTKELPPSQRELSELSRAADVTVPGSQALDEVNAVNVISQETVSEVTTSSSPSCMKSSEEYCTLVLTALSNAEEQSANHTSSTATCNEAQEMADLSKSTRSAEEDIAVPDGECEPSDVDDSYEPQNVSDSQVVEAETYRTPEEEGKDDTATEQNMGLKSEVRLKDMKKYDKDQAEAMVLGGQVQMLVVPSKHVYRCDKCSYVTCKESTLKYHSQTLCQGRIKRHKCKSCGTEFKHKRGLDNHMTNKCPTQPTANTHLVAKETFKEGFKQLTERTSDQTEHLTSQIDFSADSNHQRKDVSTSSRKGSQKSKREKINQHVKKVSVSQKKSLFTKVHGKFKCKLCSFSSVRRATVERHLRKHQVVPGKVAQKTQIFSCPSCAFKCSQRQVLHSHEKRGCMKPGDIQCTMCCFIAKSQVTLTRHIMSIHDRKKPDATKPRALHCKHCTFTCKKEKGMTQHVARKHKAVKPYCCQYCSFSTTTRHTCDVCDKTFGTVTKLRQHMTRIHDKHPTHFCSFCDFSSYTPGDVKRHSLRCHTGDLEHACSQCDAHFSSVIALQNHCKRAHQLQVCLSCRQCDYTCSNEVTLKTHQLNKHAQLKCTTCQESFETKESLEMHRRTHLTHRCQLCPFAAKTRQLLAQHLLNEHEDGSLDDKPLRCSTCPFACFHQLVLEQHLRSHGGKRLYRCTDCEYSTPNKQKITWHIRIHTGEKPYSCELCSYTCTDSSRLKVSLSFITTTV